MDLDLTPQCVDLSVSNLDAAETWYRDVLGFRRVHRNRFPEMSLEIAFLRLGDFEIELIQFDGAQAGPAFPDPPRNAEQRGITHFAFRVPDTDAMVEHLWAKGVSALFGPRTFDQLGMKLFFVRDVEGNLVKFVQRLGGG